MIQIDKPEEEPERLRTEGRDERAVLEDAFEDDSTDFGAFVANRGFDRTIYSHSSVRERLLACQHEKCCYCEKGRERYEALEALYLLARLDFPESEDAQRKLERATEADAEFSAMAREAIEAEFEVV